MTFVQNSLYTTGEVQEIQANRNPAKPVFSITKVFDAFDAKIEKFENKCTDLAIYPIIGTVTGVTKALFGIVRLVAAVALTILSTPSCVTEVGRKFTARCAKEALYGLGNIVHGTLLAIPFVGSVVSWATMDQGTIYNNLRGKQSYDMERYEYVPLPTAFKRHVQNRFEWDMQSIANLIPKRTKRENQEIVD